MDGLITPPAAPQTPAATPIFDRLSVLADSTRARMLMVVESHELTVSELVAVLQLPQSTVSRHLKVLADDGWVTAQKDGTSRRYRGTLDRADDGARQLWSLVRREIATGAVAAEDRRRLAGVLARRRSRSQEFFSSEAGRWQEVRRELYGDRFDLAALLGLLDDRWTVGDLGAGNGLLADSLAPFVAKVVAVDESEAMLEAAAERLAGHDNVELRGGRLEALPVADGELDAATLVLVLHHLAEPREALAEAARALAPGGRLLVVDMLPHEREELRRDMGHVWLGFDSDTIAGWLEAAGFTAIRQRALPADPEAKGPSLFVATGRKAGD